MGDLHADPTWTITGVDRSVRVSRVFTRNGERLRIERVGGDAAVELDAIELELLTVDDLDLNSFFGRDG